MSQQPTAAQPIPGVRGADTPPPPRPPRTNRATLPWALVVLLSVVCLALTMFAGWQMNQLTALRAERDTWAKANQQGQPTGAPTAAQPSGTNLGAPSITPGPSSGPTADARLKLARRKADDPLAKGRVDAPIVMIEWADYRCPFCSKFALQTRPELQPYVDSGSVRVEFRDLVLFGEQSANAAVAARAAGNQGRYWEYAEALWRLHSGQGHPTVGGDEIVAAANQAGVPDMAKFQADVADPATRALVDQDTAEAKQLGLNATPFFLVNTTPVSGALPADSFVQLLEALGAKK